MEARTCWPLLALTILMTRHASAGAEGRATANEDVRDDFGHAMQFGFRAGLVGGYNMIFRYEQSPFCGVYRGDKLPKDQQKVCGHGAPLALDLALSFAPLDFVEPFAFVRLGLTREAETDTEPLKVVGAGARIYTMSDSRLKIFIEPSLGFEFEGGRGTPIFRTNRPDYKRDLVIHLGAGPEFDFARYVGVFVVGGVTTGVLRSIHSELELQAGVQARFP